MTPVTPAQDLPLRLLVVASDSKTAAPIAACFGAGASIAPPGWIADAAALRKALLAERWDALLHFHGTRSLSEAAAFEIIGELGMDLPFIIIASADEEKTAIRAMKTGAHDAVLLDRLDRLVPAVEREVREARHRADHRAALEMLKDSEARFRTLASNLPGMVFHLQRDPRRHYRFLFVSDGCHKLFGVKQHELLNSPQLFFDAFETADRRRLTDALHASAANGAPLNWEGRLRGRAGGRWIDLRSMPQRQEDGAVIWQGIATNVTGAKEIEAELRASRQQLAELSFHLEVAKEEERERIARDIHDELGSILVRLKIEAALLASKLPPTPSILREKSASIEGLLDQALGTTQRVARQLRPGILKEFGLAEAIKCQSEDFAQSTGISCPVHCEGDIDPDPETSLALFRIAQEALTNIAKHAHASLAVVRLRREQGSIALEIRDNGRGISEADMNKPKSFGLRGIRERVHSLAGEFEIAAVEHGGTYIQLRVPEKRAVTPSAAEEDLQRNLF
ncbi:MAG: PAS domain-containing protein [Rhodocyclales bacterium]|nr:PAS domain-containing protein [Rhodocyclales bacterium]